MTQLNQRSFTLHCQENVLTKTEVGRQEGTCGLKVGGEGRKGSGMMSRFLS